MEIVKRDLNELLNMTDEGIDELVKTALESSGNADMLKAKKAQLQAAEARLLTIDKMVGKLYADNAEGRIDDDRLRRMVSDLEKESVTLKSTIAQLNHLTKPDAIKKDYERFFDMAKQYTHIEELTRDTLLTFVDRIEIGPKILPDGTSKVTHRNQPYRQSVRIFYRFIGEVKREATRDLPIGATGAAPSTQVGVSILNGTEVVDGAQNHAS